MWQISVIVRFLWFSFFYDAKDNEGNLEQKAQNSIYVTTTKLFQHSQKKKKRKKDNDQNGSSLTLCDRHFLHLFPTRMSCWGDLPLPGTGDVHLGTCSERCFWEVWQWQADLEMQDTKRLSAGYNNKDFLFFVSIVIK